MRNLRKRNFVVCKFLPPSCVKAMTAKSSIAGHSLLLLLTHTGGWHFWIFLEIPSFRVDLQSELLQCGEQICFLFSCSRLPWLTSAPGIHAGLRTDIYLKMFLVFDLTDNFSDSFKLLFFLIFSLRFLYALT